MRFPLLAKETHGISMNLTLHQYFQVFSPDITKLMDIDGLFMQKIHVQIVQIGKFPHKNWLPKPDFSTHCR
jgi:hypothetical protein